MQAIELNAPRKIVIEDRGRKFVFTLARIRDKEWRDYFAETISTSEMVGRDRVDTFDSTAARLGLLNAALTSVSGYGDVPPGDGWREMIPARHRLAVANALVDVERVEAPEDEPIVLGVEAVYLDAVWGADEADCMRKFHGLKHLFNGPTSDHQRRYSRDLSRSRIVGAGRNGKTRYNGVQGTLIDLYDELICQVEGYTLDGQPIAGRDQITANMDTYHKVAAVEGLFEIPDVKVEEGE